MLGMRAELSSSSCSWLEEEEDGEEYLDGRLAEVV